MLDPMTRPLLASPALIKDAGGVRLTAAAARRAVRLQRGAQQRRMGARWGRVFEWFGEGFLYIGYATLRCGELVAAGNSRRERCVVAVASESKAVNRHMVNQLILEGNIGPVPLSEELAVPLMSDPVRTFGFCVPVSKRT